MSFWIFDFSSSSLIICFWSSSLFVQRSSMPIQKKKTIKNEKIVHFHWAHQHGGWNCGWHHCHVFSLKRDLIRPNTHILPAHYCMFAKLHLAATSPAKKFIRQVLSLDKPNDTLIVIFLPRNVWFALSWVHSVASFSGGLRRTLRMRSSLRSDHAPFSFLFVSPCPPECIYKAKRKLRLISGNMRCVFYVTTGWKYAQLIDHSTDPFEAQLGKI